MAVRLRSVPNWREREHISRRSLLLSESLLYEELDLPDLS
jgi:hypothetical protein